MYRIALRAIIAQHVLKTLVRNATSAMFQNKKLKRMQLPQYWSLRKLRFAYLWVKGSHPR